MGWREIWPPLSKAESKIREHMAAVVTSTLAARIALQRLIGLKWTGLRMKSETSEISWTKDSKESDRWKMRFHEDRHDNWSRKFQCTRAQSAQQARKRKRTMWLRCWSMRAKYTTLKRLFWESWIQMQEGSGQGLHSIHQPNFETLLNDWLQCSIYLVIVWAYCFSLITSMPNNW